MKIILLLSALIFHGQAYAITPSGTSDAKITVQCLAEPPLLNRGVNFYVSSGPPQGDSDVTTGKLVEVETADCALYQTSTLSRASTDQKAPYSWYVIQSIRTMRTVATQYGKLEEEMSSWSKGISFGVINVDQTKALYIPILSIGSSKLVYTFRVRSDNCVRIQINQIKYNRDISGTVTGLSPCNSSSTLTITANTP